jgi:hypothetical protein
MPVRPPHVVASAQHARLGIEAAARQLPWDLLDLVEHELYDEDYVYNSPSDSSSDSSDGEEEEKTFASYIESVSYCRAFGDAVDADTGCRIFGDGMYKNFEWRYARYPDRRGDSDKHAARHVVITAPHAALMQVPW